MIVGTLAHNYTHVLEDLGYFLPRTASVDSTLARAFNVRGTDSFHSILATVFEPEVIVAQLKDKATRHRFAAEQMAKVLNSTGINIDFSLSPEPTRYQDLRCATSTRSGGMTDVSFGRILGFRNLVKTTDKNIAD